MNLEDHEILNATKIYTEEGKTYMKYVLPDETDFIGEAESVEHARKVAPTWCESVRDHWKTKVASKAAEAKAARNRRLSGLDDEQEQVASTIERAPRRKREDTKQFLLEQHQILTQLLPGKIAEAAVLDEEIGQLKEEIEEIEPILKKWGMLPEDD